MGWCIWKASNFLQKYSNYCWVRFFRTCTKYSSLDTLCQLQPVNKKFMAVFFYQPKFFAPFSFEGEKNIKTEADDGADTKK